MSIEGIAKKYGITSRSKRAVKTELRRRLKATHPDANGGDFASEEERRSFDTLLQDLEELERLDKALVTSTPGTEIAKVVERQTELLSAQHRELQALTQAETLRGREQALSLRMERETSASFTLPKLSGAALGAVGVLMATSSESVSVLLANFGIAGAVTLAPVLILGGALMAFVAFSAEEREKSIRRRGLSEEFFQSLVTSRQFSDTLSQSADDPGTSVISERRLAELIVEVTSLDLDTSHEVATIFAERLVTRGLAARLHGPTISPLISIDAGLASQSLNAGLIRKWVPLPLALRVLMPWRR